MKAVYRSEDSKPAMWVHPEVSRLNLVVISPVSLALEGSNSTKLRIVWGFGVGSSDFEFIRMKCLDGVTSAIAIACPLIESEVILKTLLIRFKILYVGLVWVSFGEFVIEMSKTGPLISSTSSWKRLSPCLIAIFCMILMSVFGISAPVFGSPAVAGEVNATFPCTEMTKYRTRVKQSSYLFFIFS